MSCSRTQFSASGEAQTSHLITLSLSHWASLKGDILLRYEISLKVICEKVNFQIMIFAIILCLRMDITYKVFKNIFNDVQIKDKGEILRLNMTTLKIVF